MNTTRLQLTNTATEVISAEDSLPGVGVGVRRFDDDPAAVAVDLEPLHLGHPWKAALPGAAEQQQFGQIGLRCRASLSPLHHRLGALVYDDPVLLGGCPLRC